MRLSFFVLLAPLVFAQDDYVITTITGTDFVFRGDGEAATQAQLSKVGQVLTDPQGNVFVADKENHQVISIDTRGILHVVAGNGVRGFSGDGGPATRASLHFPSTIALDAAGNLYIGDWLNYRIRKVGRDGTISTVAGSGKQGTAGDGGPATAAQFEDMSGLAMDRAGNLYVADEVAHRVRKIAPDGTITNFAGTGTRGFSGDGGQATRAALNEPGMLLTDAAGNVYICDYGNDRVRKVSPQGVITTIAGNGNSDSTGDGGPATAAAVLGPTGLYLDAGGTMYVTEVGRVRAISPQGIIRTFAGSANRGFAGDGGPAANAQLSAYLQGIAGDAQGNLFIGDSLNLRVRRIDARGIITTYGGIGHHRLAGEGGPAVSAALTPYGMAVDLDGNVFLSDFDNHRIWRVDTRGIISTYVGTGAAGYSGDGGPALRAQIANPFGLATDAAGNLYIADAVNLRVRRVDRSGTITTVVGGGEAFAQPGGTPAADIGIAPTSVAVDRDGAVFVLDPFNCVILRVAGGRATRYAGQYQKCGSTGDGGAATAATIHPPGDLYGGIAVDAAGNLYLAEPQAPASAGANSGGRVRIIDRNGVIRAFAGNGRYGVAADGATATSQPMLDPQSVIAVDPAGVIIGDGLFLYFVGDGVIERIAGGGTAEASGDGGPALAAGFFGPTAVGIDRVGARVIFVDLNNQRVRAILLTPPTQQVTPTSLNFTGSSGGATAPTQSLALIGAVPGLAYSARAVGATSPWLTLSPDTGTTPRLIDVSANPGDLAPGNYSAAIVLDTPLASPVQRIIPVTFKVGAAEPPKLRFDRDNISFTVPRASPAIDQGLLITNVGGGVANFTIATTTTNGGPWLAVTPAAGQARPGLPVAITVTANPANLAAGTYLGRITATTGGATLSLSVTLLVSANDRAIQLSQAGFSFATVSGGGGVPPRAFEVLSSGRGAVAYSVSASTLTGGAWLKVSRTSGTAGNGSDPIQISVDQSRLAPGVYYGVVRVDAPGAANSPQFLTVAHEVVAPTVDPGAMVDPSELVFTTTEGRSPSSQDVFVYNVAQALKTYRATGELGNALLVTLPKDQTLENSRPARVVVQPFVSTLAPGTYTGAINFQFTDGRVRNVRIRVIVTAAAGTGRSAEGCNPTKLLPTMTSVSNAMQVTAGWPVALDVGVTDDCGGAQEGGSVVVSFSNGDPPLALQSLKGGHWAATWSAGTGTQDTTLKVEARDRSLAGTDSITVGIRAQQSPPAVTSAGVVSAAGFESFAPLAPGGMITIFGERLATGTFAANGFPLPKSLGTASLLLGGIEVPLLFVSTNQINALVPSGLDVNTRHQLLVQRGDTYSSPVSLDVAPAQPGIFAGAGGNTKQGHIYWVRPGGSAVPALAAPSTPARAGDVLIMYGAGLGSTSPEIPAGQQTPTSQLTPISGSLSVRIGGVAAAVDFAGLAPGFGGLYQINARVPEGVSGDAVEVVITRQDLVSPPVTMAIR